MHDMEAPYRPGDPAVTFTLEDDRVLVYTTRIDQIEPLGTGWRVVDAAGHSHDVSNDGSGSYIVPMDQELHHELTTRGEGFAVVQEDRLREPEIAEPSIEAPEHEIEQEIGGDDLGR